MWEISIAGETATARRPLGAVPRRRGEEELFFLKWCISIFFPLEIGTYGPFGHAAGAHRSRRFVDPFKQHPLSNFVLSPDGKTIQFNSPELRPVGAAFE